MVRARADSFFFFFFGGGGGAGGTPKLHKEGKNVARTQR